MEELEKEVLQNKKRSQQNHLQVIMHQMDLKKQQKKDNKNTFFNFKFYQPDELQNKEEIKNCFFTGREEYLKNKARFGNHALFYLKHPNTGYANTNQNQNRKFDGSREFNGFKLQNEKRRPLHQSFKY